MEAAVEELSRGLSLASAREGANKDGGGASATGGSAGGIIKSAAAQRVEELERRKDAKKFDGMASSLFDALDAVPVRPKSLLEDSKDNTGAASSISRKEFGRGLSVIDQFALRVHSSHASSEATFNLDGTARTKATSGSLAFTAGDSGLGSGLALSSKKKKQANLSRKARQRKEKTRQRGQAYSERASGPSKRGRARGKSSRLQLI